MHAFEYAAPTTLDEAVALLARRGDDARILAGGTDLVVQMRGGVRRPGCVVDVKHLPELLAIELDERGLVLGAAVPCWELCLRDDVRDLYPGLVEAAALIGSMQIQGRASVGGNLCNGSPAADTVPALCALGARCRVAGPDGLRRVAASDFVLAPGRTALAPDEILVALEVDAPPPRSADAYLRFTPRAEMDIAVVGVGVRLTLDGEGRCREASVALGAMDARPVLAPGAAAELVGTPVDDAALAAAGAAAGAAGNPIDDRRGPAWYRRRLADVLTRRAAALAAERARSRT